MHRAFLHVVFECLKFLMFKILYMDHFKADFNADENKNPPTQESSRRRDKKCREDCERCDGHNLTIMNSGVIQDQGVAPLKTRHSGTEAWSCVYENFP